MDFTGTILQYALAAQPGIDSRVHGPVYKIFFAIAQFFDELSALVYIKMTGTAGANRPAIVVQFNFIVQANLQ
jgi:hypothetical protein